MGPSGPNPLQTAGPARRWQAEFEAPHQGQDPEPGKKSRPELGPQQKMICFAWLVENKGDPKKAKKEKGELILGKVSELVPTLFSFVLSLSLCRCVQRVLTQQGNEKGARTDSPTLFCGFDLKGSQRKNAFLSCFFVGGGSLESWLDPKRGSPLV